MPRRKKGFNFNQFIVITVLFIGVWIAADYYFNVYRHTQKETSDQKAIPSVNQPAVTPAPTVTVSEESVPEDDFKLETYRDENNKFEFQYPVYRQPDPGCPIIKKNAAGFDLGMFFFSINDGRGEIADFINSELQGMDIDKTESITVAGLSATQVNYQTRGMGWNGSTVFIEHAGKFYEFGILANSTAETCGGVNDYSDRVYRSVISTLKFTD